MNVPAGIAVFAYGSNLCVERILARVRSTRVLTVARLEGHALRFHKRGRDGSAKADAWSSGDPRDVVWGVVYELATADKATLSPFTWYRDFVLRGALHHRLPAQYLAGIRAVKAIEDPDRERHRRETAVLGAVVDGG